MKQYERLYIDFDGVICDSVYEAFVCSYLAYHNIRDISATEHATEQRALFYRYRPFIRSGQHLVLLQHCIKNGIALSNQDDFEEQLAQTAQEQLSSWREALYDIRNQLIEEQLPTFIKLHSLYPYITSYLPSFAQNPAVYILSTKKPHLISLLLGNANIAWPENRLLLSHTQSKIDIIRTARHSSGKAVAFIDDHLPHILSIEESIETGIDCYLADWGYVLPEWKKDLRYRHISRDSVHVLAAPFLAPRKA